MASTREEAAEITRPMGFPVLIRPSLVLGGRAMKIVYDETDMFDFYQ